MNFNEIPEWLVTTALALIVSVLLWWRRQSARLGFFQEATDGERQEVMKLMRERIDLLEAKVDRQSEEIRVLRAENWGLRND